MALHRDGQSAASVVGLVGPAPRSDLIVAAIDLLLRSAGLTPGELGAVVVTRGPGSFTGIRVALATALGVALGAGIPAHGFPSLLAQAARAGTAPVIAVQPARRDEVYAQPFVCVDGVWLPSGEVSVLPFASLVGNQIPLIAPSGLALPAGVVAAPAKCSTAEALLELASRLNTCDGATLVPLYIDPHPAAPQAQET